MVFAAGRDALVRRLDAARATPRGSTPVGPAPCGSRRLGGVRAALDAGFAAVDRLRWPRGRTARAGRLRRQTGPRLVAVLRARRYGSPPASPRYGWSPASPRRRAARRGLGGVRAARRRLRRDLGVADDRLRGLRRRGAARRRLRGARRRSAASPPARGSSPACCHAVTARRLRRRGTAGRRLRGRRAAGRRLGGVRAARRRLRRDLRGGRPAGRRLRRAAVLARGRLGSRRPARSPPCDLLEVPAYPSPAWQPSPGSTRASPWTSTAAGRLAPSTLAAAGRLVDVARLVAGFAAAVRLAATVRPAAGFAADLAAADFGADLAVGLARCRLRAHRLRCAVVRPAVDPAVRAAAARLAVPARLAVLGADAARLAAVRLVASGSAMGFPPVGNLKSVGNSRLCAGFQAAREHQGCSPCQRSSSASQAALRWSTSSSARAASASVPIGTEALDGGADIRVGFHAAVLQAPVILASTAAAHDNTVHRKTHMRHRFRAKSGRGFHSRPNRADGSSRPTIAGNAVR